MTYCLREWPEPDDAHADVETTPNTAMGAATSTGRGRGMRRPNRLSRSTCRSGATLQARSVATGLLSRRRCQRQHPASSWRHAPRALSGGKAGERGRGEASLSDGCPPLTYLQMQAASAPAIRGCSRPRSAPREHGEALPNFQAALTRRGRTRSPPTAKPGGGLADTARASSVRSAGSARVAARSIGRR